MLLHLHFICCVFIVCPKSLCILRVPPYTENYGEYRVAKMISNDMQNLSAPVNFLDAHYQLPLLTRKMVPITGRASSFLEFCLFVCT